MLIDKNMKKRTLRAGVLLLCVLFFAGCRSAEEQTDNKEPVPASKEEKDVIVIAGSDIETEEPEIQKPEEIPTAQPEKKGILIALDPGHQGETVDMSASEPNAPGSDVMKMKATAGTRGSYTGIPEYQLNLDIALEVRSQLTEQGYDVIMTREDNNTAISNAERASLANDAGADISVRIHANGSESPEASGALVLIGSAENPYVGHLYNDSFRLAETLLDTYCGATGMANLGIQANDTMTGINWSRIPVVILEMGFMTNEQDDYNMADEAYRQKMVEGIVAGINTYYGY